MLTVPARLYDLPFVELILRAERLVVLRKTVTASLYERPSYLSTHVLSVVHTGRQRIETEDGDILNITPGRAGLLRRGMYSVTDLVAPESEDFSATLICFAGDTKRGSRRRSGKGTYLLSPPPLPARLSDSVAVRNFLSSIPATESVADFPPRREVLPFLRRHFDKPLTLEDFAYLTGNSVSTFQRSFRAKTGTSPRRWIIARRMEKAHRLLTAGEASVSTVATAVGYQNTSHFIRSYRNTYGKTPGQITK